MAEVGTALAARLASEYEPHPAPQNRATSMIATLGIVGLSYATCTGTVVPELDCSRIGSFGLPLLSFFLCNSVERHRLRIK